jgi:hypothetical protein
MDRTRAGSGDGGRRSAPGLPVLLATLVAVLPACSADQAGTPPAEAAPGSSTALPGHAEGSTLPTPLPQPTDDPASEESAIAQATAAVTAFARPDLDPEAWWDGLAPLLSPAALEAYAGTDPAEVPASAVTGAAWSGESPSSYLATVFVPTDVGEYAVLLVREGGGTPWLVERISQVQAGSADGDQALPTEPGS